jgi:hypothetical protein
LSRRLQGHLAAVWSSATGFAGDYEVQSLDYR